MNALKRIGSDVSSAILHRNVEGVLRYDRPDLVKNDTELLNDKKSDLYCYLFDTNCNPPGMRSIYDKLAVMTVLGIAAKHLRKSPDGYYSFLLIFYDKSKFKPQNVLSYRFLCKHAGASRVVTWTFRYIDDQWESAHPPFDAEVDALCSGE